MRRGWTAALAGAGVLLLGTYVGSPYWAVKQFRAAAVSGDVDRLDAAVDFPAVRDSLKGQVAASATRRVAADPDLRDSPLAGLGMALMPMFADRMIDAFITPDSIAAMVRQGKAERGGAQARVRPDVRYDYGYRGLDRFVVTVRAPDVAVVHAPRFVFARRGLFAWKVIRIELPDAAPAGP